MPCGKRPLVKKWDKPKCLKHIKPSRYQTNEACVKVHWHNVLRELELLYKDDKFWETQGELVRDLVGEVMYERIVKIFNLPKDKLKYKPPEEDVEVEPSENFYTIQRRESQPAVKSAFSLTDFQISEEEEAEEEQSEEWTVSSDVDPQSLPQSRSRTTNKSSKSVYNLKSEAKIEFSKSKQLMSASKYSKFSQRFGSKSRTIISWSSGDEEASSDDDVKVHPVSRRGAKRRKRVRNPHFELLYCNDSETDMIKWNSHYKQKKFEVSASDEYSKKAELLTKEIAYDFFQWWISVGSADYKSEVKRPEDIEDLFQVWFDEHASRGLVLDPKVMPCVLESIANFVGVPKAACSKVLNRQIKFDIYAETKPAHMTAFDSCLPRAMKHIPPENNTKELWRGVKIPEDLRTMSYVWEEIAHLTSTKSFREWLQQRPHLPSPQFFKDVAQAEKKQLFVVPSDYVFRDASSTGGFSTLDLNLPQSQFTLEIKEVLSKLLAD